MAANGFIRGLNGGVVFVVNVLSVISLIDIVYDR